MTSSTIITVHIIIIHVPHHITVLLTPYSTTTHGGQNFQTKNPFAPPLRIWLFLTFLFSVNRFALRTPIR